MFKNLNQYSIKAIAIFDGGKGLLALIGVTLFIFVFNSDSHAVAVLLVNKLHADPNNSFTHKLLMLTADVSKGRMAMICACAYLYSVIKMSEAYGLWQERQWGRTVGILSIGVLIPFEIYEIFYAYSHTKLAVLMINIIIVAVLYIGFGRKNKHILA